MKSKYIAFLGVIISVLLFMGTLPASAASNDRYVRLRYLEGDVTIYPEDGQRQNDATINSPVLDGDVVETANGRAELSFRNGILIRLGDESSARFVSTYSPMTIELLKGTLFVDSHIVQSLRDELEIRAADAQVYLIDEGNLRVDLGDQGGVRVTTIDGEAEVRANGQRILLRQQERTYVDPGSAPVTPEAFNEGYDELDDWNASRMNSMASAEPYGDEQQQPYVDESLYYDTYDLQNYGDWRSYGTYGNVWVPHVSVGWRPYYDGRWSYSPGGWFWVSYEPWGWAPYHYGRWGWSIDFGWYWVPGYTFGPSWVSWYDYGDYIGWCPLNYYNRPIYWGNWNDHHDGYDNRYNNPVQKQKGGGIGVDNSWTFVKKQDIGTGSVKKISAAPSEVKKIHFDDSKIIRSPGKTLTSYVIPKNVKTPALVNDARRVEPAKSDDIDNPIGVNHREEWPGRKTADVDRNKSVDTNKNSDNRSPSTKQWNTRPSTTPKSTTPPPSSSKTVNPPPTKSTTKDPGPANTNKNSKSKTSTGGGNNDKKVSKPQPPHYMNRDEQFERLRSTYERDNGLEYRKQTSSPYQRYESPTRKSPYDSVNRNPSYRNSDNDSNGRDSEVSPRYYEGARKMLERLDESKGEDRQPSTVSPRSEPKSAPRSEPSKSSSSGSKQYNRPSPDSRSMKSSPSRQSPPPSSRPVKKKD